MASNRPGHRAEAVHRVDHTGSKASPRPENNAIESGTDCSLALVNRCDDARDVRVEYGLLESKRELRITRRLSRVPSIIQKRRYLRTKEEEKGPSTMMTKQPSSVSGLSAAIQCKMSPICSVKFELKIQKGHDTTSFKWCTVKPRLEDLYVEGF